MQHEFSMNWLHQKELSKLPDSGILPFVKAQNGATDRTIRTYLKMRFKLYRCYNVTCEWCLKPLLNLKNARWFVISELCKRLAPSTLFAGACLSKKQKENSKRAENAKAQPALNK